MQNFGPLFVATTVLATALMTPAPVLAEAPAPTTQTSTQPTTQATQLTIELSGFKKRQGQVFISIFDSKAAYNGKGRAVSAHIVKVDAAIERLTVQLPRTGTYGFRMFHDVDGDGKMDTNFLGIPSEPFAFSNNASGFMGPAKWADAKFRVAGATKQSVSF